MQCLSFVLLTPMLLSITWYPAWRRPPLALIYQITLFTYGFICANLYAQHTVQETASEYIAVSFFRFASEVSLVRMAWVRFAEARSQLHEVNEIRSPDKAARARRQKATFPIDTIPNDLEAPLVEPQTSLVLSRQLANVLRPGKYLEGHKCAPIIQLVVSIAGGLLLTLPWVVGGKEYPTSYDLGIGADDTRGRPKSHLPLWLPYGASQAGVYAGFYTLATLILLLCTGLVVVITRETKEMLIATSMRKRRGIVSSEIANQLAQLQLSHALYVRFECLIFLAATRYALSAAICAQLAFSDSLTGAMALMLLVQSMLYNSNGVLLFFLFGMGEGAFHAPLERFALALQSLGKLADVLADVFCGVHVRARHERSIAVDEVLHEVEHAAGHTGYGTSSNWQTLRRAAAANTIQRCMIRRPKVAKVGTTTQGNPKRPPDSASASSDDEGASLASIVANLTRRDYHRGPPPRSRLHITQSASFS